MNNPNPLIPQGSLLEQQARSKPHLRIALFIVAVHVVFLGLLLMQGCKREPESMDMAEALTNDSPYGIPDRSTLFVSNTVPDFDLALAQEPVMNGQEAANDYAQRQAERPGVQEPTNATPEPVMSPELKTPPVRPQLVSREHEVVTGDTFFTLGKKYEVSWTAIAKANPNVDPNRLRVGQKLIIPPPGLATTAAAAAAEPLPPGVVLYEVKPRDNLTRIAQAQGTTVEAIRQLNGMTSDRIYVGRKLKIPARTNAAARAVNP
jgi:LysM repeat protein